MFHLPIEANFVNKNNVVCLCDREHGSVGREGQRVHQVARLAEFGVARFRGELVPLLAHVVKQVHHTVGCAHGKLLVVGRPCHRLHLGFATLQFQITFIKLV